MTKFIAKPTRVVSKALMALIVSGQLLSVETREAQALVLELHHMDQLLSACSGFADKTLIEDVKAETFAFIKSSISQGSANILDLRSMFVLNRGDFAPSPDPAYEAYANCAKEKAADYLKEIGIRIVHDVTESNVLSQDRSLAFIPSALGLSRFAFQPVVVSRKFKTIIELRNTSCNAEAWIPAVVYPLDSYQPPFSISPPSDALPGAKVGANFTIEIDRDAPVVASAIAETKRISQTTIDKSDFENYIAKDPDVIWVYFALQTRDQSCSTSMSVRTEPKP